MFFGFGGLRVLLVLLQLDGDAPEEFAPWIPLVSRVIVVGEFPTLTTYELDGLAVPVLCEVEGNSDWKPERQLRAEFEKPVTEICRDDILPSNGARYA